MGTEELLPIPGQGGLRPDSLTLNASIVVVVLRFLTQAYHTVLVLALSEQQQRQPGETFSGRESKASQNGATSETGVWFQITVRS